MELASMPTASLAMTPTTRIGYHYYPDDQHFTRADLDTWLPILQSLAARWIVLQAGLDRAAPETFIRGMIDAGIQPIVRIPAAVARLPEPELAPILRSYAGWGVQHVVIFDRPNLRRSWAESEWARPALVERFLDLALPVLLAESSAGLKPVFPPLEPGGDYWDTAFLAAALEGMVRRGHAGLAQDLTLAVFGFTFGHPLDWGKGGPTRWPESRPYHTPAGAQDQIGFRAFDWCAAVAAGAGLPEPPTIVVAGGALPGSGEAGFGPDRHAEENAAIARALATDEIPAAVGAFAFYLLAAPAGHTDARSAWFPAIDSPRPVVDSVRRALASEGKPARLSEKPIRHYLLLPSGTGASLVQEWTSLSEFTARHRPTVGFSPAEARLAARVTIAGDENAVSRQVEDQLIAAGCVVDRLGPDHIGKSPAAAAAQPFAQVGA
jgi:hypothetical protein